MSPTASFERVWETLRCLTYDSKKEQLLNFHIITPQIPNCKAWNRFQVSYNVKYFELIKHLKESPRSRSIFRTHVSIYDRAFSANILNVFLFLQ